MITTTCQHCGQPFQSFPSHQRKYCSKKCYGAVLQLRTPKGADHPQWGGVELVCKGCGKLFHRSKYRMINQSQFCTRSCYLEWAKTHNQGPGNPYWANGEYSGDTYRGNNWNEQREKALKRDNYRCTHCGSAEHLHIHHKNPFRDFDDWRIANELSNLETLCNSCHMKRHHETDGNPRWR